MPIIDQDMWRSYEIKNKDSYGKACVDVAREAMRLLDESGKDLDTHTIICEADDNIKAGGITGFMAGCVAQMIYQCHSRGKEFKKKWNEYYGVEDNDGMGTVNPAIVTIGEKES